MDPFLVTGLVNVAGNVLDRVFQDQKAAPATAAQTAQSPSFDELLRAATAEKLRATVTSTPAVAAEMTRAVWQSAGVRDIAPRTGMQAQSLEINSAGSLTARLPDGTAMPVNISPEVRQSLLDLRRFYSVESSSPLVLPRQVG